VNLVPLVRKVEAYHIQAGFDQFVDDFRIFSGRAEGGDDFGSTQQIKSFETASRCR
jgi:hypothetical protein